MAADQQKTVEYMIAQNTATSETSGGSNYSPSAKTVRIEEGATGRTFKNVYFRVRAQASSGTMTAAQLSVQIDSHTAVVINKGVTGDVVVTSGEDYPIDLCFSEDGTDDLTSEFNTNFDGNSHSITVQVQFTGPDSHNHSVELVMTYDYDSADTTHTNTIRKIIGYDTNINQTPVPSAGTWTIPDLDDLIPDHLGTPAYNDIYLEIRGIYATDGDPMELQANLDSGGYNTIGWVESASKMPIGWTVLYDLNSIDTTTTHTVVFQDGDAAARGFQCLYAVLVVTYRQSESATTKIRTIECFIGQEDSPAGTSEITQSAQLYLPESSLVKESIWFEIAGTHFSNNNTLTVKGQAEATGTTFTTNNTIKAAEFYCAYDITSLVTISASVTLTAKLTNNTATTFDGRHTVAFVTYKYADSSTEKLHMVKYLIKQADDDDLTSLEQALTITLPAGGKPRDGYIRHTAMNSNLVAVSSGDTQTLSIDGTATAAPHQGEKEGHRVTNIADVMDVLTFENFESSHTYKNEHTLDAQCGHLIGVFVFNGKVASKTVNVKEDVAGTNVANAELVLLKRTAGTPDTWEVIESKQADASGDATFDIFETGDYVVGAHQEGATIRADLSNIITV